MLNYKQLNLYSRKKFIESLPNDFLIGAEVGVSNGDFSKNILEVRQSGTLYLIDIWETNYQLPNPQQAMDSTISNVSKFGKNRYQIIKKESILAAQDFSDNFFDFVYIDADHNYEPVLQDLTAWFPKVKDGGILSGHDYCNSWPGVIKAVNEFCSSINHKVEIINPRGFEDNDQDGGSASWFIVKGVTI